MDAPAARNLQCHASQLYFSDSGIAPTNWRRSVQVRCSEATSVCSEKLSTERMGCCKKVYDSCPDVSSLSHSRRQMPSSSGRSYSSGGAVASFVFTPVPSIREHRAH